MPSDDQQDYDNIATSYDSIEQLPHSAISQNLVLHALDNCSGQVILDLGGGSGLHARNAIAKGALRVDNVDISPEMLKGCSVAEEKAGRTPGDKVACYVGDVTKSLEHLNLPGRDGGGLYDVVLMIWTFDHATTLSELETMWHNTAKFCAPGGKVISIRSTDPRVRPPGSGKYGVVLSEVEDVPGPGVRYKFTVGFEKPFVAHATNLEANFDLEKARAMAKKFGFLGLEVVPAREMEAVKRDPEFWREFVSAPGFICVVGTKGEL